MNSILKNIIFAVGAVAILVFAFAAVSYVNSYGKSIQPSSFRSFSVSGDGRSISIPDVAEFSFTVITEGGKDLSALQKQNTESANKVIAFVKSNGVADKDVKTGYYNVNPRYTSYGCYDTPVILPAATKESVSPGSSGSSSGVAVPMIAPDAPVSSGQTVKTCPPSEIVGYTVTQSVSVKMRDFAKVGDIMGGVVTNGANQVGSLSFTLDDPTKAENEARAEAIVKAKSKAESVARAGGFALGQLLSIQEGNAYPISSYKSYSLDSAVGLGGAERAPAPTIEPGSQETNVTVTMIYEIR